MADEPQTTPAAESLSAEASIPATPQSDPTPTQTDSKKFNAALDADIDSLWAQAEGKAPRELLGEDATPEPEPKAEPKAEAPKKPAEPKPETPPAEPSRAEIEQQAETRARAKIEAEQQATRDAEARIRAEQQHKQAAEAYVGPESDYTAVNTALRQALTGDYSALDGLDVVLPNGQTVSQVKGAKGLTQEEAANLLTAWDTARKYESVMGDRKVQRILDLWNSSVMRVLSDPDVDTAAVTRNPNPDQQMEALRDSVRDRVTKRLSAQHDEVVKAKDAEIEKLTQRVTSLTNERGNLASQRTAAAAASVDRPGQPGALRPSVPSPEELAAMPFEEAFKSGAIDRVLQSLPGGLSAAGRRRAG